MLTRTAKTENPPAMTVISIGHDIGFSAKGSGGTARGIVSALAGGGAACCSALCSAGGGAGLAAGVGEAAVKPGLCHCAAVVGASTFAFLVLESWLPSPLEALEG